MSFTRFRVAQPPAQFTINVTFSVEPRLKINVRFEIHVTESPKS